MADKQIGELTPITALDDESLLVVEQHGNAGSMSGKLFREFAEDSAKPYVDKASKSADFAALQSYTAKCWAVGAEIGGEYSDSVFAGTCSSNYYPIGSKYDGPILTVGSIYDCSVSNTDGSNLMTAQAVCRDGSLEFFSVTVSADNLGRISNVCNNSVEDLLVKIRTIDPLPEGVESAKNYAETARQYSGNPPIIQNDTWWTWNAAAQKYVDTGNPASGNLLYATFDVNPSTGILTMHAPDEYNGPAFSINNNGNLVVTVNG